MHQKLKQTFRVFIRCWCILEIRNPSTLIVLKYILLVRLTCLDGWNNQKKKEEDIWWPAHCIRSLCFLSLRASPTLHPLHLPYNNWIPSFYSGSDSPAVTSSDTPSVPSGGRSGTVVQLATVVVVRVPCSLPPAQRPVLQPLILLSFNSLRPILVQIF